MKKKIAQSQSKSRLETDALGPVKVPAEAYYGSFTTRAKRLFKTVKCFKPAACRDSSRETYIVGMEFTGSR